MGEWTGHTVQQHTSARSAAQRAPRTLCTHRCVWGGHSAGAGAYAGLWGTGVDCGGQWWWRRAKQAARQTRRRVQGCVSRRERERMQGRSGGEREMQRSSSCALWPHNVPVDGSSGCGGAGRQAGVGGAEWWAALLTQGPLHWRALGSERRRPGTALLPTCSVAPTIAGGARRSGVPATGAVEERTTLTVDCGHTMLSIPDLVRSRQISVCGPSQ